MKDTAETGKDEKPVKNNSGFFYAPGGGKSMRRLGAFILILASIGGSFAGAFRGLDWRTILVLTAVPLAGAVLLLFFTTWGDVEKVIKAAKGKGGTNE